MPTVVCATSMTSATNLVLNLVCIWLLFIVMADIQIILPKVLRPGSLLSTKKGRPFPSSL